MMNVKSIFKLVFLLPFALFSQEVLFFSGLENDLLDDWQEFSATLEIYERNTLSKYTDLYGFQMKFNGVEQKGNLTTKANITWEKDEVYKISFRYKAIAPSDNNESNIKVFSSDGTKIGHINFSLSNSEWSEYTTEFIPSVSGSGGYVLFSFRSNDNVATGGEYYFDDFSIEKDVPGFFDKIKTTDLESDPSVQWVQFGPGMSGNNKIFYEHPTDPDTHFISPNMGNSYRSTDRGFTYQTTMDPDARSYKTGYRGPVSFYSLDFSRQNTNFGLSTGSTKGALYATEDNGETWSLLEGTQGVVGENYLSVVSVDPSDDDVWYLGVGRMRHYGRLLYPQSDPKGVYLDPNANGRLWKSTDKGQTWTLSNNGIDSNAEFSHILVDPVDSSIVYASTNYGFYKSTDAGATWILKSNGIDHDMILSMDMHHNKDTDQVTIFALSNITWKEKTTVTGLSVENDLGGVFKSTDKGETWTNLNNDLPIDLSGFSGNSGIVKSYYTPVAYYFGLDSWEDAQTAYPVLPTSITTRFNTITVDPNDVNNLYLVNEYSNSSKNNFKPGQIWRSKNGGANWYVTFRNGKNWNNGNDDAYWVTERDNPMGSNVTFKYKGDWLNRDDYERKGCNYARFNADGSVLYTQLAKVGFVSYDKGDTWVDIDDEEADESGSTLDGWVGAGNSNVPGHGFYQSNLWPNRVFCPSGENSLWITNDEGPDIREDAQGAAVMQLVYNDNGDRLEHSVSSIVIHPTEKDTWFATFFRQARRGELLKTTDAGATWDPIGVTIPQPWDPAPAGSGDQAVHQVGLMIDKNNPDNMYFCVPKSSKDIEWVGDSCQGWGVHKSSDVGVTWSEINSGLPSSLDVARIAFDPNDSNILYAAVIKDGGGLYKSANGGGTWSEVASTALISGSSGINDIHFDSMGRAYITSGFKNEPTDSGGLFVSDDNMVTWTKIFDYPWVNRVEVAKYNPNIILLSTLPNATVDFRNGGAYVSKDAGATWRKINKGNGQAERINDIAIDYTVPGKFYASTRGSGWYTAQDPSITEDDVLSVKVIGTNCIGVNNGSLQVSSKMSKSYSATLIGEGMNKTEDFTGNILFSDLSKGNYSLTIHEKENQTEPKKYEINVTEPDELEVSAKVDESAKSVELDLKGGDLYTVTLNKEQVITGDSKIKLQLKEGTNSVQVETNKGCQGIYESEFLLEDSVFVFPNPVKDVLNVGNLNENSEIKIISVQGEVLIQRIMDLKIGIDVSNLKSGVYFYKLYSNSSVFSGRFLKK